MESPILRRMQQVLECEAQAILAVRITPVYEQVVAALKECRGKVITTGIGKAGHIAHKFAATLCSTGTPATFLHPAEAAHGDLGLVGANDCLVAFSTSGKSLEVLETIEFSKHLGVNTVIGITSHPDSAIHKLSDFVLDMGSIKEACSLGLTPTASIAVMLAISDAIAVALMEAKGITRADFGVRHHGGYLGRQARTDNCATEGKS